MIWMACPPVVAFSIAKGKRPAGATRLRIAVKLTLLVTLIFIAEVSCTVIARLASEVKTNVPLLTQGNP